MTLFLDYLGTNFKNDDQKTRGSIISILRGVFDEYLCLTRPMRDYRRLSNFLEAEKVWVTEEVGSLKRYTLKVSKDLLRIANLNVFSRGDLSALFERHEVLGNCLALSARVGLSDN
jgi:hypothetical protein